jgi:hypothetical protein
MEKVKKHTITYGQYKMDTFAKKELMRTKSHNKGPVLNSIQQKLIIYVVL